MHCSSLQKDFLPLWFLYSLAAMNALLVRIVIVISETVILFQVFNASSNILIYLFAGQSFRAKFLEIFGITDLESLHFSLDVGIEKILPFCFKK